MMPRKKMMTVFGAAVLAIGLTACGGSSTTPPAPEPEPMPPAPSPLELELGEAQAAAATAAAAAKMAADAAEEAAMAAEMAAANLATSQTNEMARAEAMKARMHADAAMAEYMKAMGASEQAAAATSVTGAVRALVGIAERSQDAAETANEMAGMYSEMAIESAMGELKIADTVKSVGDSTVDATAAASTKTVGEGAAAKKVVTGLLAKVTTTGAATDGRTPVHAALITSPATKYKSPRVNAAARSLAIGKRLDTSDDAARLLLFTHYAGTKTVKTYVTAGTDTLTIATSGDGTKSVGGALATGTTPALTTAPTLTSEGSYYLAEGGAGGATAFEPLSPTVATPPVQQGDGVGEDTKPKTVYSFTDGAGDTKYVVETISATPDAADTTTTVTYGEVTVKIPVNVDGIGASGDITDHTDVGAGDEMVAVTAQLPSAIAYDHVHFGAWAALGAAKASGAHDPSALGIGFVQSIGEHGMTGADMPNNGSATYTGNWAATIQAADDAGKGDVALSSGAASLTANFTDNKVTAGLAGLAALTGTITGSTFSGTSAAVVATHQELTPTATFTGSFNGGFYGPAADEAAGIFDFASTGNKAGAFRGAFGGQRDPAPED